MKPIRAVIILSSIVILCPACSLRHMAMNSLATGLSSQKGGAFASDDVPELVRDAVPFGLKLNETVLAEVPDHKGLLLATASGFMQYGYAFYQMEALYLDAKDPQQADQLRGQAKRLYRRAMAYAVRALDIDHPGFMARLRSDPESALKDMTAEDVPALYALGASWGAAISMAKRDLGMLSEIHLVAPLMNRALALDPDYHDGALHEFFIAFDGSRPEAMGGSSSRARAHFEKAVALTKGMKASPYISLAEQVCVPRQDVKGFKENIDRALAIDPESAPGYRLENILSQKKGRWLKAHMNDLFLDAQDPPESTASPTGSR